MISSSYDFQTHLQRSQRWCHSQTALLWFDVLPGLLSAHPGFRSAHPGLSSGVPGAPRLVVVAPRFAPGAPRCSQVHLKATASFQSTLEFDHPGILVWQLSDTPRGSQWPKYILLMSSILSRSCDRLGSGTMEWISILRTRHPILHNTRRSFWSRWRMNTVQLIDVCQSINLKVYQATISSPPQWHQDPVNHPLICMLCPTMLKNTWHPTMWLKQHPDETIVQHAS